MTDKDGAVITEISDASNHYGGLRVTTSADGGAPYFWSAQSFGADNWEEIPCYLYDALMCFELDRNSIDCTPLEKYLAYVISSKVGSPAGAVFELTPEERAELDRIAKEAGIK